MLNSLQILLLILLPILMLTSAFFSAAETSLTSISKAYVYQLSKKGDKNATLFKEMQDDLARTIGTFLISNQIINHTVATISTWLTINIFGEHGFAYVAIIMGFMLIVYTEITPKMVIVKLHPQVIMKFASLLYKTSRTMLHIAHLAEKVGKGSLWLFGFRFNNNHNNESFIDDELRGAIALYGVNSNQKFLQKKTMIMSILDLSVLDVGQIMVHRKNLVTINGDNDIKNIIKNALYCPYSRIPVWRDNSENIVGILKVKTMFKELYEKGNALTLEECMQEPWFVPESTKLIDQLYNFRRRREHFCLVVDEYGSINGAITLEDILEEIVGDITDEYDTIGIGSWPQTDGSIIVDGLVNIRDINREFHWSIKEDSASTVGGLAIFVAKKIPEVGNIINVDNYALEILGKQRNRITLIKITKN